jgi:hypothetical protein
MNVEPAALLIVRSIPKVCMGGAAKGRGEIEKRARWR